MPVPELSMMQVMLHRPVPGAAAAPDGAPGPVQAFHGQLRLEGEADLQVLVEPPIGAGAAEELRWGLEVIPRAWLDEPDRQRAAHLRHSLAIWGQALYEALFSTAEAQDLARRFFAASRPCQMAVKAEDPAVLALPWELLTSDGRTFPFLKGDGAMLWRQLLCCDSKGTLGTDPPGELRLLLVVCRPSDEGFLDPFSDARSLWDAMEKAPGRLVVEWLWPPTLEALRRRFFEGPPVHLLHLDGHGLFRDGEGLFLMEDGDGRTDPVPGKELARCLMLAPPRGVVVSACESAAVKGPAPAHSSLAGALVQAGIPAVLAMSHRVRASSTARFFRLFYGALLEGQDLAEAVSQGRQALFTRFITPEKDRPESPDFLIPVVYGDRIRLLGARPAPAFALAPRPTDPLPDRPRGGLFGRARVLFQMERAIRKGQRRVTLVGWEGAGKGVAAAEAGRWFCRLGLVERVVWVDLTRPMDPSQAVAEALAKTMGAPPIAPGQLSEALVQVRTLLILHHAEAPLPEPRSTLLRTALGWAADKRLILLITATCPLSGIPGLGPGDAGHLLIRADALSPEEGLRAIDQVCPALSMAAPRWPRSALLERLRRIGFLPSWIPALAEALTQGESEADRLVDRMLMTGDAARHLAAVREGLSAEEDQALSRLAVLQGGGLFGMVVPLTGLALDLWKGLAGRLEEAGLLRLTSDAKLDYAALHPSLGPLLLGGLGSEAQGELRDLHQTLYTRLSDYLMSLEQEDPALARQVVGLEQANLLAAARHGLAHDALAAGPFAADCILLFQRSGLVSEAQSLLDLWMNQAGDEKDPVGSWLLSAVDPLVSQGRPDQARELLSLALEGLPAVPSEARFQVVYRLAQSHLNAGQMREAEPWLREADELITALSAKAPELAARWRCLLLADQAELLLARGALDDAEKSFKEAARLAAHDHGLAYLAELRNRLGQVVLRREEVAGSEAQGSGEASGESLASENEIRGLSKGIRDNLPEPIRLTRTDSQRLILLDQARAHFEDSAQRWRGLKVPASEASALHNQAIVFQRMARLIRRGTPGEAPIGPGVSPVAMRFYEQAEELLRRAGELRQQAGLFVGENGLAMTYGQLARQCVDLGQKEQAERWLLQALNLCRDHEDLLREVRTLHHLAVTVSLTASRLEEACTWAREAITRAEGLSPMQSGIAETWRCLADFHDDLGQPEQASAARAQAASIE